MISVSMGERCTIDNIQEIKSKLLNAFNQADKLMEVDVSELHTVDTAGIQLFVAGMKEAAKRKVHIRFKGPLLKDVIDSFLVSGVRYGENDTTGVRGRG